MPEVTLTDQSKQAIRNYLIKLALPLGGALGLLVSIAGYFIQEVLIKGERAQIESELLEDFSTKFADLSISIGRINQQAENYKDDAKTFAEETEEAKIKAEATVEELMLILDTNQTTDLVALAERLRNDSIFIQKIGKQLPYGSIMPSMLNPEEMASVSVDWKLADGSNTPPESRYYLHISRTLPDLRGVFLRGTNQGRNDGFEDVENRDPGNLQTDSFKSHHHHGAYAGHLGLANRYGMEDGKMLGEGEVRYEFSGDPAKNTKTAAKTSSTGERETRPKNVAVNYYIKIN